ncbi:hypothetical protein Lal_00044224 [Lupinus albus]|nr:hypothetical protein Lal_00044224 [Lupinus albus]
MEVEKKSRNVSVSSARRGHIALHCPTKRTMVLTNGVVKTQSETSSKEESETKVHTRSLKAELVTRTHPSPYKLQWLSEVGEMVEAGGYVEPNSRSNSLQEGGDDSNPPRPKPKKANNSIKHAIQLDEHLMEATFP